MEKRLFVFDVDETLITWDSCLYGLKEGEPYFLRPFAETLIEYVSQNHDIALYSTANEEHVNTIAYMFFSENAFVRKLGSDSITHHNGMKVKNLDIFKDEYDLNNVVLLDDKPRNGVLHPYNFIQVRRSSYYDERNLFDNELYQIHKMVQKIEKSEQPIQDIIKERGWNIR